MEKTVTCKTCGEQFTYEGIGGRLRRYCDYCTAPKNENVCKRCGVVFQGNGHAVWCSDCRPIAHREESKRHREERKVQGVAITIPESKLCPKCQEVKLASEFSPQRDRPNGLSGICKACRSEHTRHAREAGKWKPAPRLPKMRECPICGKSFDSVRGAKYCSDECFKEDKRRKACVYNSAQKPIKERECRECGSKFTPEYGNKRRMFCSDKCMEKHGGRVGKSMRRARMYAAGEVENLDPFYILKRDRWRCYICGCATPKKLRGTCEPNAPQVDHVIPLARGGAHTESNTRCICRACNIAKSDKLLSEMSTTVHVQLRLL